MSFPLKDVPKKRVATTVCARCYGARRKRALGEPDLVTVMYAGSAKVVQRSCPSPSSGPSAAHQPRLWIECPTCKHGFTGSMDMELGRACARWEPCRSRPEVDSGRLTALANSAAALSDSGDNATARPLFEELVVLKQKGHKALMPFVSMGRGQTAVA